MNFDFVLRDCHIAPGQPLLDIGVAAGKIAAMAPGLPHEGPSESAGGRYVSAGLVETHIHLDKAGILGRCPICEGTLTEAVTLTAVAKAGFTEDDVYARARHVLEQAIVHGTTRLRTFVEIDPRAGTRSFRALRRLKADCAHLIDIEICAFAQEGLTQEMETLAMLDMACREGADLVGGCPYTDPDPARHIGLIFDLAERHGTRVDFHIDFDLSPERSNLSAVIAETRRRGFAGKVSLGHVTQLSALPAEQRDAIADALAAAGIAVTVLPATDLFLLGRDRDHLVPRGLTPAHLLARRGVVTSLATNNVLNPFTPFGDASLIRMANFYANVAQVTRGDDMDQVVRMITSDAAKMLGGTYGLTIGAPADMVIFDAPGAVSATRQIAPALAGWKRGRPSFRRAAVEVYR
ncbi:amidohydrolase family protein [Devosia neptuniae]|uniref:Amidohydrolase family protein n=1 Tax=Devosia neptuniae TaxID=191302 RepID=A0ABY6CCX8_9HYPH|nr:amidohydrolase family protein [Devosia neptuniae]UXN68816.1 amidohydrolase family protein [Devosia neptuniae]